MLAVASVFETLARGVCLIGAWVIGAWVFSWVSLILHEGGHYAAGRVAGLPAGEVRLGAGRIWRIFSLGATRVIVHWQPICGWVAHRRAGNRLQEAICILGGPLATAAWAFALWRLHRHLQMVPWSRAVAEFRGFCQMFAMMETARLALTLWPSWCQLYGQRLRNDGLLLWHLFFPGEAAKSPPFYQEVTEALRAGKKDEAVELAREAVKSCESKDYDHCQELLAGTLVHAGRIQEAAGILREQLVTMRADHPKFWELADSFACLALYHHVPALYEESEKLIRQSLKAHPQALTLKGTLGGLLAENGADDEALPLLRELHARAETETDLGISAAYLSMLARRGGKEVEAAAYRDQALNALPEHALVQRVLAGVNGDAGPEGAVEVV
jgi:tetratricopeptide (TPR) repeat protein